MRNSNPRDLDVAAEDPSDSYTWPYSTAGSGWRGVARRVPRLGVEFVRAHTDSLLGEGNDYRLHVVRGTSTVEVVKIQFPRRPYDDAVNQIRKLSWRKPYSRLPELTWRRLVVPRRVS